MLIPVAMFAVSLNATTGVQRSVDPAPHIFSYPELLSPPQVPAARVVASLPAIDSTSMKRETTWFAYIGTVRALPRTIFAQAYQSTGPWAATVNVAGAARLRLRVLRPDISARFWVCGRQCSNVFTSDLAFDGELWTPSVEGESITLISDATRPQFALDAVAEIFPSAERPQSTSCFIDAACSSEVADFKSSVAQLEFITGSNVAACTGGLILDSANKFLPYLLTAHHCIGTPAVAATVEATWDFVAATCGGPTPSFASLPHTNGSAILATSDVSDVTLLNLSSNPPGRRWFLGWRAATPNAGTRLLRVSHPATSDGTQIYAQAFSTTVVDSQPASCVARPQFIYSQRDTGGAGPGSSGAPAFDSGGHILGQLLGGCGLDPTDGCTSLTRVMDGSFAQSYPYLAPFLEDGSATQPVTCVQNSTTLCLNGNRFAVNVSWKDHSNNTGNGTAVPVVGDSGYFWFFSSSNIELVVKVLDGRALNNKFWVFYGSLTDVTFTMTVRDSQTGRSKTYFNASGNMASQGDTSAFDP